MVLVLDAWGKPEAGFLTGILNWVGDYDECINIKVTETDSRDSISGRYCTGIHQSQVVFQGQVHLASNDKYFLGCTSIYFI